jgi:hypothetical protein
VLNPLSYFCDSAQLNSTRHIVTVDLGYIHRYPKIIAL